MAEIRWAERKDLPAVLGLIKELADYTNSSHAVACDEELLGESLFSETPAAFAFVASVPTAREPAVVGYTIWYETFSSWQGKRCAWIDDIYVTSEFRGSGIGTELLEAVRTVCTDRQYARLEWVAHDWNLDAMRFYKSRGAVPKDEFTIFRLSGAALVNKS